MMEEELRQEEQEQIRQGQLWLVSGRVQRLLKAMSSKAPARLYGVARPVAPSSSC